MTNHLELFSTSSLSLACAVALWYPLHSVDKAPSSSKAVFNFVREEGLDELLALYHAGRLQVEPQAHYEMLRRIKQRLYEKE